MKLPDGVTLVMVLVHRPDGGVMEIPGERVMHVGPIPLGKSGAVTEDRVIVQEDDGVVRELCGFPFEVITRKSPIQLVPADGFPVRT